MFTCDLSLVPAEVLNSWTLLHAGNSTAAYLQCLKNTGNWLKAWGQCQRPLHNICPRDTGVALNLSCHHFMEWTRQAVPVDVAAWPSVASYKSCMKPVEEAVTKCLPHLQKECDSHPVKAGKILRTRMHIMEDLIKEFPNIKVIHQIRDPRGVIVSRRKIPFLFSKNNITLEAQLLCNKMLDDIRTRKRLEKKYPDVFLETKYESLASNPVKAVEIIHAHAGLDVSSSLRQFVHKTTNSAYDGGPNSAARVNGKATAFAWRNKLTPVEKQQIDSVCSELYHIVNYEI